MTKNSTSTRITDVSSLCSGDHILVWDTTLFPIRYQHHGIVTAIGTCVDTIHISHIYSPLKNRREAQKDAKWTTTNLRTFLHDRKLSALRLVQYTASLKITLLVKWGEAHMRESDIPSVVLARAEWLMNQGQGQFNILRQNCEHAAFWCKTGQQWCKQTLIKRRRKTPFPTTNSSRQALFTTLQQLTMMYTSTKGMPITPFPLIGIKIS